MDNHPIPQDVTHFQFKLIGNLTLKQFGYVAAGGILGWITFSLPFFFLLKLLLGFAFAGSGLVFAFIPIEGRPADLMLSYFFRALFQPNQYLFQKQGIAISFISTYSSNHTAAVMTSSAVTPIPQQQNIRQQMPALQAQPAAPMYPQTIQPQPISSSVMPITKPLQQTSVVQYPTSSIPVKQNTASLPNQLLDKPQYIQTAKPVIINPSASVTQTTQPQPVVSSLENQLQRTLDQKKQLEEQLAQMQQLLQRTQIPTQVNTVVPQPQVAIPEPTAPPSTTVSPVIKKIVNNNTAPASKIPLASDFPNIIMGVVRDARGNVLPNILIEVKDGDDNPVRAFKTNALGQFASATPLLNGTYTIVFEDPAKTHSFDALQIAADGDIMQPIEVISLDQREELRKELFG